MEYKQALRYVGTFVLGAAAMLATTCGLERKVSVNYNGTPVQSGEQIPKTKITVTYGPKSHQVDLTSIAISSGDSQVPVNPVKTKLVYSCQEILGTTSDGRVAKLVSKKKIPATGNIPSGWYVSTAEAEANCKPAPKDPTTLPGTPKPKRQFNEDTQDLNLN
jgi:hypothetical protein